MIDFNIRIYVYIVVYKNTNKFLFIYTVLQNKFEFGFRICLPVISSTVTALNLVELIKL